MLGEVDDDLRDVLGNDTVPLPSIKISLVLKMKTGNHGLLMGHRFGSEKFNIMPESNGDILQYPEGDRSVPASMRMPKDGFYHDSIIRQKPIVDESEAKVEDQVEEYSIMGDEDLAYYEKRQKDFTETDRAVVLVE